MERKFVSWLKDPAGKHEFILEVFEQKEENILEGLLINPLNTNVYAITNGVPVMVPDAFRDEFLTRFKPEIERLRQKYPGIVFGTLNEKNWSFSLEWETHAMEEMETTWGWTTEQRFDQALIETGMNEAEIKNKILLDAGCGNGLLTEYFSLKGMTSFGLDYSDSIFIAERRRTSKDVCFIKGDLLHPPFCNECFDIIVSNGVIHHMPSTETTFYSITPLVKASGKFYLWLYSRNGTFSWRLKRRFFDICRIIVCRLPVSVQKMIVHFFTFLLFNVKGSGDKKSLIINMYDSLTPRWRHYHTPEEISRWFYQAGFGPVILTHWDNRYGFGAVATKTPLKKTPGEHW